LTLFAEINTGEIGFESKEQEEEDNDKNDIGVFSDFFKVLDEDAESVLEDVNDFDSRIYMLYNEDPLWNEPVLKGSHVTKFDLYTLLLFLKVKHSFSKSALVDFLLVLSSILTTVPSLHQFDKKINNNNNMKKYLFCRNCKTIFGKRKHCCGKETEFFLWNNPVHQFIDRLKKKEEFYKYREKNRSA
jgi:hypothetical protein